MVLFQDTRKARGTAGRRRKKPSKPYWKGVTETTTTTESTPAVSSSNNNGSWKDKYERQAVEIEFLRDTLAKLEATKSVLMTPEQQSTLRTVVASPSPPPVKKNEIRRISETFTFDSDNTDYHQNIRKLQEELAQERRDRADETTRITRLETALRESHEQLQRSQTTIDAQQSRLTSLEDTHRRQHQEALTATSNAETQVARLQATMEGQQETIEQQRETMVHQQGTIQQQRQTIEQQQSRIAALEHDKVILNQLYQDSIQNSNDRSSTLERLQTKIVEKISLIKALRKDTATLQKANLKLQEELAHRGDAAKSPVFDPSRLRKLSSHEVAHRDHAESARRKRQREDSLTYLGKPVELKKKNIKKSRKVTSVLVNAEEEML